MSMKIAALLAVFALASTVGAGDDPGMAKVAQGNNEFAMEMRADRRDCPSGGSR